MYMKDGSPKPGFTPVQHAIAAATHDAVTFDANLHRPGHRYPSGTNDAAVKRATMYDTIDRELSDAWRSKAPPTGSYPANDANEGDACTIDGAPGTLRAIAGHDAWLECRPLAKSDAMPVTDARERAYADYQRDLETSWRKQS